MQIENKKSRKHLATLGSKQPLPFAEKFPNQEPQAICLLKKLLAFDPIDRPTAEQVALCPILDVLLFEVSYVNNAVVRL